MHEFYLFLLNAYSSRVESWSRQHLLISFVLNDMIEKLRSVKDQNTVGTIAFAAPQLVRLLLSYSDAVSMEEQSAETSDTGPDTPRHSVLMPTLPFLSLEMRAKAELTSFICHVSAHSERLALRLALEVRLMAEMCHKAVLTTVTRQNQSCAHSCFLWGTSATPTASSQDMQTLLDKYATLLSLYLNIVIAVGTANGASSITPHGATCEEVCSSFSFTELFQERYPTPAVVCALVHIAADSPPEELFIQRTSRLYKLLQLVDLLRHASSELLVLRRRKSSLFPKVLWQIEHMERAQQGHETLAALYSSRIEDINAFIAGEQLYLPTSSCCDMCGTPRSLTGVRLAEGKIFRSRESVPMLVMFDCPALDEGFCENCSYSQALNATYSSPRIEAWQPGSHISLRCKESITGMPLVEKVWDGTICRDSYHSSRSSHSSLSHSTNRTPHTEDSETEDENDVDIRHSARRSKRRDSWRDLSEVDHIEVESKAGADEEKCLSEILSTKSDAATIDLSAVRSKAYISRDSAKFTPITASIDAIGVLSKSGMRISTEQLISQMLVLYQIAFDDASVTVHHLGAVTRQHNFKSLLTPYTVVETFPSFGLAEFLPNVKSFHEIKGIHRIEPLPCGPCTTCFKGECCPGTGITLTEYFFKLFGKDSEHHPAAHNAARLNFVRSLAPNLVTQYLLAIKDRHNGNILLHNDGRIIHVDFAFSLGSSPGGARNPEQPCYVTPEILEMMDGHLTVEDGSRVECIGYFKWMLWRCFLGARANRKFMESWMTLSLSTGMAEDLSNKDVEHVLNAFRQRHWLHLEDYQVTPEVIYEKLIIDSISSTTHCGNYCDLYGLYQSTSNGINR